MIYSKETPETKYFYTKDQVSKIAKQRYLNSKRIELTDLHIHYEDIELGGETLHDWNDTANRKQVVCTLHSNFKFQIENFSLNFDSIQTNAAQKYLIFRNFGIAANNTAVKKCLDRGQYIKLTGTHSKTFQQELKQQIDGFLKTDLMMQAKNYPTTIVGKCVKNKQTNAITFQGIETLQQWANLVIIVYNKDTNNNMLCKILRPTKNELGKATTLRMHWNDKSRTFELIE